MHQSAYRQRSSRASYLGIARIALIAIALQASSSFAGGLPNYTAQKVGPTTSGLSFSFFAFDINNSGQIVGVRNDNGFVGNAGSFTTLPVAGGYSYASHISNNNLIVGTAGTSSGEHAVFWNGATLVDLHGASYGFSRANSVNSSGQVVGVKSDSNSYAAPTLWENGNTRTLPTLSSELGGAAQDINDAGISVGFSRANNADHPVYWDKSTVTELTGLGGSSGVANAINSSGWIAGTSRLTGDSASHATLWINGTPTDLGVLGGLYSNAFDINDNGYVIGRSTIGAGSANHAVLWADSAAIDLNNFLDAEAKALGWVLTEGVAINAPGQILVIGRNDARQLAQFFLLTPSAVPEPATWLLAVLGVCFLGARSRLSRAAHVS